MKRNINRPKEASRLVSHYTSFLLVGIGNSRIALT